MGKIIKNGLEYGSGGGSSLPPGGTQGQVLTKQSATDGDADWDDIPHDNAKANSSSLAPVETTTTSEHAYTVGDHLMLAGGRFLVTADIAVGDTLDVSTNIQAVNLEDETGLSQADFAEIITPLPGEALDGVIISPEERRVGWYYNMNGDGTKKPLYQRTYDLGSNIIVNCATSFLASGGVWYSTNISTDGIETLVKAVCTYGDGYVPFLVTLAYSNTRYLTLNNASSRNMSVRYITIQYTKTTDTYA